MREDKFKDKKKEGHRRGERHRGKDHGSHQRGAKTFRRGRAIAFLEMLNLKRATIKKQLEEPEFQAINQILLGELKAIDLVINEFVQVFEIQEGEAMDFPSEKKSDETFAIDHKDGDESDETN